MKRNRSLWSRKISAALWLRRAPVALERLEYRERDGLVHYRGNWHRSLRHDHQLLPALALLVPHVLLRFQCVIRSYGALSTTVRRRFGWVRKSAASDSPSSPTVAVIEGKESEFVRVRTRSGARSSLTRGWRTRLCAPLAARR